MPLTLRKHGVLTPLQQAVVAAVFAFPEAAEFGLAGGTALAEYGFGHRTSDDLDFFTFAPDLVRILSQRIVRDLPAAVVATSVRRGRDFGTYQELFAERGDDVLTLAIGAAAPPRLGDLVDVAGERILSPMDLIVDELHALYDRREPRDWVDLAAIVTLGHQDMGALEALLFAKDEGILSDRLGWVDAFLAPARRAALIPDALRVRLRIPLADETLRAVLEREGTAAMHRIQVPTRAGWPLPAPAPPAGGHEAS